MKAILLMSVVLVWLFCPAAVAGEAWYEVYYFHASWRCGNCTNAEAWTGEAVTKLQADNPDVTIRYIPKQLETNAQLVSMMNAQRVDVAVAEVIDGRIVRYKNLGNILRLVGSKTTLVQYVIDGFVDFRYQSKDTGKRALNSN